MSAPSHGTWCLNTRPLQRLMAICANQLAGIRIMQHPRPLFATPCCTIETPWRTARSLRLTRLWNRQLLPPTSRQHNSTTSQHLNRTPNGENTKLMAEVVGLVSAIGAIVTAGFKISRAILQARDDFGAATSNVRSIAVDTKVVMSSLRQIRDRISTSKAIDCETAKVLDEILTRCKADIGDIEASLLPLIGNMESPEPMSRRQRMRWLFAKSRICGQQAALGSLKLTLSLFIHSMQMSDGYNIEYVASLQSNILSTNH